MMSMPASTCRRTISFTALPYDSFELRLVDGFAPVLREQHIDNVLRARQAADVGGENAILTYFHLCYLSP